MHFLDTEVTGYRLDHGAARLGMQKVCTACSRTAPCWALEAPLFFALNAAQLGLGLRCPRVLAVSAQVSMMEITPAMPWRYDSCLALVMAMLRLVGMNI